MFDLAKAFAATYNPATGLYIRKDRLLTIVPDGQRSLRARIGALTKKYPAKLVVKILTEGYPDCPCCGRKITKPNMCGDKRDEFIKTCGRDSCQRWYLQQGSAYAKELQTTAKQGFEKLLQPYMKVVRETEFRFIVKCTRCGRERERYKANAHAHCSCSKGALVRDTRAANSAHEKAQRITSLRDSLPDNLTIAKVHSAITQIDLHCSSCDTTQTKWLCSAFNWQCGCGKLARLQGHWDDVKKDTLRRTKAHLKSLGIKYLGPADNGGCRVRCACGKEFVPNQPLMLKYGCKSCSVSATASTRAVAARATSMQRYGVAYPSQHWSIQEKVINSGYRTKTYKLGSRTLNVRGYEPQAIDYLLSKGIKPQHIRAGGKGIPSVQYRYQGKDRRYFPDILLKARGKRDTLIEVKSTWTLRLDLPKILAKKRASEKAGYAFHLFVMAPDGSRLDTQKELRKCRKWLKAKSESSQR